MQAYGVPQAEKIRSAALLCEDWRMEISSEMTELRSLFYPALVAGMQPVEDLQVLNMLQRSIVRKYKNLTHQIYAYIGALGKMEDAVRPGKHFSKINKGKSTKLTILDLTVKRKLEHWIECEEFGLDKDVMRTCFILKNSRDSLEHCNDGDTHWWITIGYQDDIAVIFHGKGRNRNETGLEPLKYFEAFRLGRLDYTKMLTEIHKMIEVSGKGGDWHIVTLPLAEVSNIMEELLKVESRLAKCGGLVLSVKDPSLARS